MLNLDKSFLERSNLKEKCILINYERAIRAEDIYI